MRTFLALLFLSCLLCSTASAEFSLVGEFFGRNGSDLFGFELDMDGDYAVVGAYEAVSPGSAQARNGSAHVLHRGPEGWVETQVMYGDDDGDWFGYDVAISGDWIAVSSIFDSEGAQPNAAGAVHMYKKDASGVFQFKQRLSHPEPTVADYMGFRISMDGDRLIAGVPQGDNETSTAAGTSGSDEGSVLIFERSSGDSWAHVFTGHGSDMVGQLGHNVAISGDYAFGGAHQGDSSPSSPGNDVAGVVIVYHRSAAGVWSAVQTLIAPTPETGELFSRGLDADDDLLVAAAAAADDASGELSVFRRDSSGQYVQEAVIPGPSTHQLHGLRISIAHGVIATGSPAGRESPHGLAVIYQFVDGTWTLTHTIQGTDASPDFSLFSRGIAVEVTATHATLLVGAHGHVEDGQTTGGAWVYEDTTITLDSAQPIAATWTAPCGCDGLGSSPISAHASDATSVTLSFKTYPAGSPCAAEPSA